MTSLKAKNAGVEKYSPSYLKAAEENLAKARKSWRETEAQNLALKAKMQAEIALAQSKERLIEQQIAQTFWSELGFRRIKSDLLWDVAIRSGS